LLVKALLSLNESLLCFNELMMNCLTHVEELTEGLRFLVMLSHVIFTEAFIDKLASLVDKIACSSGKLR